MRQKTMNEALKKINYAGAIKYNTSKKAPAYWPQNGAGKDFARICAMFQHWHGLEADGYFGPKTEALVAQFEAEPKPENYLIAYGRRYAVPFKCVTYEQDPKWSSYPAKHFGWRTCAVEIFILHWDAVSVRRSATRS